MPKILDSPSHVPQADIPGFKLKKAETLSVAVKAANKLGVNSWDWARIVAVSGNQGVEFFDQGVSSGTGRPAPPKAVGLSGNKKH